MFTFAWKDGSRVPADARTVGAELQEIARRVGRQVGDGVPDDVALTADDVVQAATDPASPLHGLFEWDDSVAADHFRRQQARTILYSIRIESAERGGPRSVVAYVSVKVDGGATPVYVPTSLATHNDAVRRQVLADARRSLRGWVQRYQHLSELASVFDAVNNAVEQLDALVEMDAVEIAA